MTTISKENSIKHLKKILAILNLDEEYKKKINQIIIYIENKTHDTWVSVKTKFPDNDGSYLLTTGNLPFVGFYRNNKGYKSFTVGGSSQIKCSNVTYWKELPQTPNENYKENKPLE